MKKDLVDTWPSIFKGMEDGKKAFCGPHTAQIDLTDRCNNACIGCWVHSPLLDKSKIFPHGERELPFKIVKKLIDKLYHLGTREIFLSGSGEPFMYPYILDVIGLIKLKGIYLNIITNGTLINEEISKFMIDKGVDLITVSMWAGTPKSYTATHPGKSDRDFGKIKENLNRIAFYKQRRNSLFPHIKIYNVICSKNYYEIEEMINFARDVDADSVEFQVIDTVEGKTDFLALNNTQMKGVFTQLKNIRRRKDMALYNTGLDFSLDRLIENEFLDFGKLWKDYKNNFRLLDNARRLICPKNYEGARKEISYGKTYDVADVHAFKYKFIFDKECNPCVLNKDCFNEINERTVKINLLNILNIGTFLRRLSCSQKNRIIYDIKTNSIPCYTGWYYCRILTDGSVIPCCKASKFSLGNLHNSSFFKIWNSPSYKEFRFNAKHLPKDNPYFSKINCLKSCDNWGMNLEINERLTKLSLAIEEADNIVIPAKNFISGNFNRGKHNFGRNLIVDGGDKKGFAQYEFEIANDDIYEFWSRYAAEESRPLDIYIDENIVKMRGLEYITEGWTNKFLEWHKEFDIRLDRGKHVLQIRSSQCIPHIEKFAFFKKRDLSRFVKKEKNISYFEALKQRASKKGIRPTLKGLLHSLTPNNLKDRYLEMLGIYDGEHGYKGPFHVQIDLTNNCNNSCIACWCNSPLLGEKRLSIQERMQYLPLALAKNLLDEVTQGGATEVYYSGSGEPFMHPQIMEVLEYTKKKNLTCHVNTNFTLLTKERLDCLMDIGVDFLTVSLWSATPETYTKTHINRTKEDFYKIKENLIYLNTRKKDKPCIKLYNVIFNMNYFEVEEMVKFAGDTKSESLEFTLVDTIPNATDVLALDKEQAAELVELCKKIRSSLNDDSRIEENGVLIFQFDQFLRRISVSTDVQEAKYDRNIIDSMPCYIGWLFARIIPNGEVHSCLKAHRIPTGSLYLNRFSEIWNSKKQAHFRKKTCVYQKNDPFFKLIGNDSTTNEAGCYKSCDDIGRNNWMHNRMKMLSAPERIALKGIAETLKIVRRTKSEREDYKDYSSDPIIAGIIHGRKAFAGPEQVVIDPTNRCNLRCISCWLYSPLLTDGKPSNDWLKEELSKDVLIKLIDDLSSLGTKRIRFTGGGEPFMHKDLMKVIEYARKKGLLVAITTNFGLVSKDDIKRLIDLGLEELCVSIWGSDPESYSRVHPGLASFYFGKLKENLLYLKETRTEKPRVTFANVIMNNNFRDFERMYDLGLQYGADALYFTIVDIFPNQTDNLLLNEDERKELLESALKVKIKSKKDNIQLEFFDGFLRRISNSQDNFKKGEYDKIDIDKIPCYVGWIFSRILADGNVVPCCKGVKKIMGNIKESPFKDIWSSTEYNRFRARAKYLSKNDLYFKDIGCIRECDNMMHNEVVHRKLIKILDNK